MVYATTAKDPDGISLSKMGRTVAISSRSVP
jgi:hypothetical protein